MTDHPSVAVPAAADYVLPGPPRGTPGIVVVGGRSPLRAALRRSAEAVAAVGRRQELHAASLGTFLHELHERLAVLDASISEATRAQLKGLVRDLGGVLGWCDAVQQQLAAEGGLAAVGLAPLDVAELCREVAAQDSGGDPVDVTGDAPMPWWGSAPWLADLVACALQAVAERTRGCGPRGIEVSQRDDGCAIRVYGLGDPGDAVDPATINRLLEVASARGARIVPDHLGPGGAGLLLQLPNALP